VVGLTCRLLAGQCAPTCPTFIVPKSYRNAHLYKMKLLMLSTATQPELWWGLCRLGSDAKHPNPPTRKGANVATQTSRKKKVIKPEIFAVRVTTEDAARLKLEARARGLRPSTYIRELLMSSPALAEAERDQAAA